MPRINGQDGEDTIDPIYHLLLHNPKLLQKNLRLLKERGHIREIPTLWQVFQGMAQQWWYTVNNLETLGHDFENPIRDSIGAKLLQPHAMRFLPLMIEGAINPADRTGLALTPERKMRHILGTHHPPETVIYDLQLLDCYPGALDTLRAKLVAIIEGDDFKSRWLKDLVVYEGYHESILPTVDRAIAGDFSVSLPPRPGDDFTVGSFAERCLACPPKPDGTIREALGVA